MKSVYSAVQTGSLNKTACASSLRRVNIKGRNVDKRVKGMAYPNASKIIFKCIQQCNVKLSTTLLQSRANHASGTVVFNVYGSVHHNNILIYISNKMHKLQSLFYLTTALHVSGVTITHLQEHKTTVTTASGNCYTVLLSAAIVEELELI